MKEVLENNSSTDLKEGKAQARGSIRLFLAAVIWGVAFVAQRVGMDHVGPFTFNAVRNLIGAVVLLPAMAFLKKTGHRNGPVFRMDRSILMGGAACGFFLFIASNLQQVGLQYTSVGKAGFITALYIVTVPVLGILLGKRTGLRTWISVAIAVIGLYLLCMTEKLTISGGDILELLCAFAFAFQILAVDRHSRRIDPTMLACMEFAVCGGLSLILAFLFETITLQQLWAAGIPILYAGVLSCGVAYTLQIVGQRDVKPALASLIMSLESVVSAIAGWLLLGQRLTLRELFGCAVMFAAILLAQMPAKTKAV